MFTRRDFIKTAAVSSCALTANTVFGGELKPSSPHRFIFIRRNNGLYPSSMALPSFNEAEKKLETTQQAFEVKLAKHELPVCMKALEPYKDQLSIIQGLSSRESMNGHGGSVGVMGAYKSQVKPLKQGIDFALAEMFSSPIGHIQFRPRKQNGISPGTSAIGPGRSNHAYLDAETARTEIFKFVQDPSFLSSSKLINDSLSRHEVSNLKELSGLEKIKIQNQLNTIKQLQSKNQKLSKIIEHARKFIPDLDKSKLGGNYVQRLEEMIKVLIPSVQSGLTNVVLLDLDNLSTLITGLPGIENAPVQIHSLGHGDSFGLGIDAMKIREKYRTIQFKQIVKIIEGLRKMPEGNGTMFDNTTIVYFPDNGERHHGEGYQSPRIIISGKNSKLNVAGRYIRIPKYGEKGHKTLSNFYTTFLNAYGNSIEHFGDSDTELVGKKVFQHGAIKEFIS